MKRILTVRLLLDYLLYLVVRALEVAINLLPERASFAVGRFAGRLVYLFLADRRSAAIENLTIAFGKCKPRAWIIRTARKSFEHVGMLAVEFLRIRRWNQDQMAEKIIIEGRLPFNLTMGPGNHGILLLNSHFGCFEVSAAVIKFLGVRLNLVQSGLKNPFLSVYFYTRGGTGTGIKTYGHKGIVNHMISLLQAGEMVAVLADQRGDPERGFFVDFFGTPAPANEVFARFAIDGDAQILPLCTYRRDDGRYQSVFGECISIELTGDRQQDLMTLTRKFHDQFEQWLRLRPEQGFWLQRKWRRKASRRRSRKNRTRTENQPK